MGSSNLKDAGIGGRLRQARVDLMWSQRRAASESGYSDASVSRWETGESSPSVEALSSYATTLQIPSDEREQLIALLRRRNEPHWVASRLSEQQQQMVTLIDLEQSAREITAVAMNLVPSYLQVAAYARAMMRRYGQPEHEITTRVAMRMGRREVFQRRNPAHLRAFIGEGVLRQRIGGAEVMLEQFQYLLDVTARPNVTVQVIPEATDWHPGLDCAFKFIEFGQRAPVVEADVHHAVTFFESDPDVACYRGAVDRVAVEALDPDDSAQAIASAITVAEHETGVVDDKPPVLAQEQLLRQRA